MEPAEFLALTGLCFGGGVLSGVMVLPLYFDALWLYKNDSRRHDEPRRKSFD